MSYETVKNNFYRGLWPAAMVRVAVTKGVITPEQFEEITGEAF